MVTFFCKRAVEADEITGSQKFFQTNICQKIHIFIGIKIKGKNLHAESPTDSRHCQTDLSGTYNASSFAIKIYTHKTIQ